MTKADNIKISSETKELNTHWITAGNSDDENVICACPLTSAAQLTTLAIKIIMEF